VLRANQDEAAFSPWGGCDPFSLNLGRCLSIAAVKILAVSTDAMIPHAITGGQRVE